MRVVKKDDGYWYASLRTVAGKHYARGKTMVEAARECFKEALYGLEYITAAEADGQAMMAGDDLR
jgi:predicted RNase H-like HicB family nuclease